MYELDKESPFSGGESLFHTDTGGREAGSEASKQ
jgi:hypothetical protein